VIFCGAGVSPAILNCIEVAKTGRRDAGATKNPNSLVIPTQDTRKL
jgi:hypothetical protein